MAALTSLLPSRRRGTAVGARSHIGISEPLVPPPPAIAGTVGRFSTKRVGAVVRGGINLSSTWLFPSIVLRAKPNGGPWIVAGDWNGTPEELTASRWPNMVGGVIAAPTKPVSRSLAHAVHHVARVRGGDFSPHYPARLYLRACPRAVLVRHLKRPWGFGAVLPFGPPCCPHAGNEVARSIRSTGVENIDLHQDYAAWVTEAEKQVSGKAGHDDVERARRRGHGYERRAL